MSVHRTNFWRLALIVLLVFIAALALAPRAQAVEVIEAGRIPADTTIDDDVFIAYDVVHIDGIVNGDLFVAGGQVFVDGTVRGSLVTAAQTITVNGQVEGSLYAGGSALQLGPEAQVGRNLYFGGYSLETAKGSQVGRDLLVAGYQALISGESGRDVRAAVAALELDGVVGRHLLTEVAEPNAEGFRFPGFYSPPGAPATIPTGLRIAPEAEIGGDIIYVSPVEQAGGIAAAPAGQVVYQTPEPGETTPNAGPEIRQPNLAAEAAGWLLARVREWITLMLLGAAALWLLPALFHGWVERAGEKPLPAMGWGLVAIIAGYAALALLAVLVLLVAGVLGLITLGGLARVLFGVGGAGLVLIATSLSLVVVYVSKLIVSYLVGWLILRTISPRAAESRWLALLIGVSLYVLMRGLPLVGWLVGLFVTLLGVGAIFLALRDRYLGEKVTPSVA